MKLSTEETELKLISTEQLHQEAQIINQAAIALGLLLIVLLGIAIFINLNYTPIISLLVVPFALLPILFVVSKRKLLVTEEIKGRKK
ncbi:hypothetical protein [Labilibaculum sp.]|uniref:hypothetical protein n=1 Tax=Labilibaculum sp. TaxID=2060723 RepID=UPI003566FC41